MVTIAGAGPSGLYAGLVLAQEEEVQIVEKSSHPGGRFQGGFQVLENYSFQEDVASLFHDLSLPLPLHWVPLTKALFWGPTGEVAAVFSQKPFGYLIKRGKGKDTLEACLHEACLAKEVTFSWNTTVEKADVLATGPKEVDGVAMEEVFQTDERMRIWVWFHPQHFPGGYAYCFTYGGWGTLGVGITRQFSVLKNAFALAREWFLTRETFPIKTQGIQSRFMNFFLPKSYEYQGMRFVGEAGGIQDFFFGLGIRYGLLSASQLLEIPFSLAVQKKLGMRLRVSLVNRFLYERFPQKMLRKFFWEAQQEDFRHYIHRWIRGRLPWIILVPWVKTIWKRRKPCRHFPLPHWCRKH